MTAPFKQHALTFAACAVCTIGFLVLVAASFESRAALDESFLRCCANFPTWACRGFIYGHD